MITDVDIRVKPAVAASEEKYLKEVSKVSGIKTEEINASRIIRRSIDARQRDVMVNLRVRIATGEDSVILPDFEKSQYLDTSNSTDSVIIVGAGPAGLFAALRALELGIRPILLERGKSVEERRKDIARISREGEVDPDSNYCFGEGGAGTFSDGKLYTRSKKRGNIRKVLSMLYQHGASEDILIDVHPHIGSDKLPGIIENMRHTIEKYGGKVMFNTRVEGLLMKDKEVVGVVTSEGEEFYGPVVLATGHSARDTYRMLHQSGVRLEAKGLAMGVRLEHPQELIDRIQYHSKEGRGAYLPPAEYSFVEQVDGRGVYSFCMCPGGVIVPAVSVEGESVVNGMSSSSRGSRWANSGMVVEIRPGDFPEFTQYGPLEMLELQEQLEKNYYHAAGRTLKAPAQRMTDFIKGKVSSSLPPSSYTPGLMSLPVHFLLPPHISDRLRKGLEKMGRKSKGFVTPDATLIGLESRTSSPIRIPRNPETMQHVEIKGLYPAGEGAGYAGGIVSAAIDGIRCIEALAETFNNEKIE